MLHLRREASGLPRLICARSEWGAESKKALSSSLRGIYDLHSRQMKTPEISGVPGTK
jgi:hypothetical protein